MGLLHALFPRSRPSGRSGRPFGFTLIELLVTMAIAAILLAVGVPAMQQFMAEHAAAASADELAEGLRLARTEATKRGLEVSICASSTTTNASPACSDAANDGWMTGWIITDANGNLIRVQNAMRGISAVACDLSEVTFRATGMAVAATNFELTPTGDSSGTRVRTVSVTQQGRVKIVKGGGT